MLQQLKKSTVSPYPYILLGLLLLAAPFLLFPTGYKILALLLLPTIWLIRWRIKGNVIPQTPLDGAILLILIMALVSMWATFDLSFSIGKIAGLLLGIAIYYAVVDLARTKTSLQTAIIFFILSGLALASISILGTHWLYKFPLIVPLLNRLPAVLRGLPGAEQGFHPNQVGGVLIFFIPLQLVLGGYWLKETLKTLRVFETLRVYAPPSPEDETREGHGIVSAIFFGGSLLITAGVLLLTQSRGAIGGLAVGLVTIAAIRTRWGKVLAAIGLLALLVALHAGFVEALITSGSLETEAIGTLNLKSRYELWSRAIEGIADFPFTGMGMNGFRRVMPILYPAFSISPTWDFAHAHNHFLQVALDLGIPGLVAYLALWLGAGFLLFQTISQATERFYQIVALGLIGSFTAYFVYGITDTVALGAKPGFVFWWALALVVATHHLFYQNKLRA